MRETAETKNKALACLLPLILILSASRRFSRLADVTLPRLPSVAHLERYVSISKFSNS
jgi:hypothetical protein